MISSRSSITLWLSLTALSLMWGSSYLFIKLAIAELPPFALAAARAGVAATALAIGFAIARQSIHFSWKQLIPMIVLGTTNGWLPNALTAFASLSALGSRAGRFCFRRKIIADLNYRLRDHSQQCLDG